MSQITDCGPYGIDVVSAGVDIPYRDSYFESSELTASFRARGVTGLGAFLDWRPKRTIGPIAPSFRIQYFRPGPGGDQPITINDDISTTSASFHLLTVRPIYPMSGRAALEVTVLHGGSHESLPRYVSAEVLAATGPRLARWRDESFLISVAGGYRVVTAARQEGNFFANRNGHAGVAGLMFSLTRGADSRDWLSVTVTRDVSVKNGLRGWRATAGIRTTF